MRCLTNWSKRLVLGGMAFCLTTASAFAESLDDLVVSPPTAKKLAGEFKFTEGPAWSPQGFLLFSDIPNSRIVRYDVDGQISSYLSPSGKANGLVFDASGNLYACQGGARQVVLIGITDGKIEPLASQYDQKPLNAPNDLALDNLGGLYFTDPYYGPETKLDQPVMGVYYVNRDGVVTRVVEDRERPNGVLVSSDQRTLYVAEPNKSELWAYSIEKPGKVGAGKLIFTGDAKQDGSGPDGLALDAEGRIYATYGSVVVLSPTGELIGRIEVPERPANCTFGGADGKTLFVTARTSLYGVAMKVAGQKLAGSGPQPRNELLTPTKTTGMAVPIRLVSQQTPAAETTTVKIRDLSLEVPKSWKQQRPSSNFRAGQFEITPAEGDATPGELTISFFEGDGGGIDPNIARWVGQFAEDGRTAKFYSGTSKQGKYYLADIDGTYNQPMGPPILRQTKPVPGSRMLGVIVTIENKGNYFLKLTGPDKTIAAQRNALRTSIGADKDSEKPYELK